MTPEKNLQLAELLRATAHGDSHAFKRLYEDTSSYLYAMALQMMQDDALAEDVLQDAFVQVWHRAGDYHADRGSVLTWLTTIVRYRAIDLLRKRRSSSGGQSMRDTDAGDVLDRMGDGGSGGESGPLGSAMATEDAQKLDRCIKRLSNDQKQSVALAFFRGMTHQELAECLAEPLGTIKSRLRRGLQRLRECLSELGYGSEIPGGTS